MRQSGRRFGRYQLLEPIARGGMAEVWRAKLVGPRSFERPMVIKRILPQMRHDSEFVRMFVAEARLSAWLHHPNIVQVFELGDVDGEFFMAIEYVAGVDMASLLGASRGPLPLGLCALVGHEICRALAYAHDVTDDDGQRLAIVHRDVSPSNVMLGYDGQVRLLDFGIAKALGLPSNPQSRIGNIKGKICYTAPEVLEGESVTHASDLFAVGVLMHEMLTGRRLFIADDRLRLIQLIRACAIPLPSTLNPAVPPELDRLTMRAMARDRSVRYAHADEMIADFEPLLHELRWSVRETADVLRRLKPALTANEPSETGQLSGDGSSDADETLTKVVVHRSPLARAVVAVGAAARAAKQALRRRQRPVP